MGNRPILSRSRFLLVVLMLVVPPPAFASQGHPTDEAGPALEASLARLGSHLWRHGLEARGGYFQLWGADQCLPTYELMGTCFFNNPTAPYVVPVLPYWPEEFVDPATHDAFGETRSGFGATFRLDPDEAILIFGFLPPEAHYFGLQSYTFTHEGRWDERSSAFRFLDSTLHARDVFFHAVPLNPERIGFINSLSDSINNVVVERQSGASWNELRYFIITPARHMDRRLRQTLRELGVDEKDIFTERIPANVRIGLEKRADDFLTALRYSMPLDGGVAGTPSDAWRHDPSLEVLRIRDARPDPPRPSWPGVVRSAPWPSRFEAWTASSPEERTAAPEAYLAEDLTRLVYAVSQAWGQPCDEPTCSTRSRAFVDTQSPPFDLVGPLCAEIGMDCQGDAQDASYQFIGGITFDDDEVWAIIGTLGTETGNATYTSLGVNNFRMRLGAMSIDYTHLEGSADPAFYPDVANPDKLFVYYFARDCGGLGELTHGFCAAVEDTELMIPVGDRASITERDYIVPGTQRGPDSSLLLPSRALRLTRPAG